MNSERTSLQIDKMPDGGFVVFEAGRRDSHSYCGPLFACTDIGEALTYVRNALTPKAKS